MLAAVARSYASLHQKPRDALQDRLFKSALAVMGDLYASAIGTTVLQLKEIPPRPAEFDGVVCLFDLQAGRAAGVATVLVDRRQERSWPDLADRVVQSLAELL